MPSKVSQGWEHLVGVRIDLVFQFCGAPVVIGTARHVEAGCGKPEASSRGLSFWTASAVIAVVTAVLAVALLGLRLRYGIDLLDESYYAAGSYRFALGMRPLIDDLGAHQFASYLVSPFVRLWLQANGNLDGIILGLRVLYFCAALLGGAIAFAFLRRVADWRIALVSSVFSIGLVPLLIFAPSYNTIALISLGMCVSLAGIGMLGRGGSRTFILAGAALGIATIAYPTVALSAPIILSLLGWRTRSWRSVVWMAGGASLVGIIFLLSLRGSFAGIPEFQAYNRAWVPGESKFVVLSVGFVRATWKAPATWLMLIVLGCRVTRHRVPTVVTVLLPVATLLAFHVTEPWHRTMTVSSLVLLSALVSGTGPIEGVRRDALTFALVVGGVVGVLMAFTSNNGFVTFGVGAAVAGAPAMAVLLNNAREALTLRMGTALGMLGAVSLGLLVTCLVVGLCWEVVTYEATSPLQLTSMGSGPFAGLMADNARASESRAMAADLAAVVTPADRLLVYGANPSASIESVARPVSPNLWMSAADGTSYARAQRLIRWLRINGHRPTVVVVASRLWASRTYAPHDYLLEYIDQNYTPVVSRLDYVILNEK